MLVVRILVHALKRRNLVGAVDDTARFRQLEGPAQGIPIPREIMVGLDSSSGAQLSSKMARRDQSRERDGNTYPILNVESGDSSACSGLWW